MTLRELLEQRASLVVEMRAITSAPAGDGGDLSADQAAKFETAKRKLEALEQRIARQQTLDEAERRMQGTPITGAGDNRFDEACRDFSLRAAIAGASGLNVEWGRERELSVSFRQRCAVSVEECQRHKDCLIEGLRD